MTRRCLGNEMLQHGNCYYGELAMIYDVTYTELVKRAGLGLGHQLGLYLFLCPPIYTAFILL